MASGQKDQSQADVLLEGHRTGCMDTCEKMEVHSEGQVFVARDSGTAQQRDYKGVEEYTSCRSTIVPRVVSKKRRLVHAYARFCLVRVARPCCIIDMASRVRVLRIVIETVVVRSDVGRGRVTILIDPRLLVELGGIRRAVDSSVGRPTLVQHYIA